MFRVSRFGDFMITFPPESHPFLKCVRVVLMDIEKTVLNARKLNFEIDFDIRISLGYFAILCKVVGVVTVMGMVKR